MAIKIGIVDDKSSNRNILKNKLLRHGHFDITIIAVDGKDFLTKMQEATIDKHPDVVLMDLEMPNMDGVDTIAAGTFLFPLVKFVVLTIFDDDDKVFSAIKAGAFGYLLKEESAENITEMLWQMYETGAGPISPGIAHKILQLVQHNDLIITQKNKPDLATNLFNLTKRELEILELLVEGLLYKQIGAQLDISVNTAKKHVMNIYQKLHVNNKTNAIRIAYSKGLIIEK